MSCDDDDGLDTGVAERQRLRGILCGLEDEDFARVDPPPELWGRIASALEDPGAGVWEPRESGSGGGLIDRPQSEAATLVSLDQHRRQIRRRVLVAAVAAALVLLGATGALLAGRGDSGADQELVASATLEPLEPIATAADVRLVQEDDQLRLVVDAPDMAAAPPGRHYELWLLGGADDEPVDLGPMGGSTAVPVPDGVDIAQFDVVDISLQEVGQTEHSDRSLLRGTLA